MLLELPLGLLVADNAGDAEVPRFELRRVEVELEVWEVDGEPTRAADTGVPGLILTPGWTLITPAATPPLTGSKTAGAGGGAAG